MIKTTAEPIFSVLLFIYKFNKVNLDTVRIINHSFVPVTLGERERVAKIVGTSGGSSDDDGKKKPVVNKTAKVGPNQPCPCGSGRKYKHCCGRKS